MRIQSLQPSLRVITSKQRPRKLSMTGNDGRIYEFLLKGHEDLRQDERVMQLFALINTLVWNIAFTLGISSSFDRAAVGDGPVYCQASLAHLALCCGAAVAEQVSRFTKPHDCGFVVQLTWTPVV